MDNIEIKFSAGFHELEDAGYSFPVSGQTSLADLLAGYCAEYSPETLEKIIDPRTRLIAAATLVTVNGRSVKSEDPETTMLSPGDSIYITRILIGG